MRNPWILVDGATGWQLGKLDGAATTWHELGCAPDCDPAEVATSLQRCLRERDAGRLRRLVIGIASHRCLVGHAPLDPAIPSSNFEAKLFALETILPISAEDTVADYLETEDGLLGVAVAATPIRRLVNILEMDGIDVVSIVPTSLLALQEYLSVECDANAMDDQEIVVWQTGDHVDVFCISDGGMRMWCVCPADASDIARELAFLTLLHADDYGLRYVNVDHRILESLPATQGLTDQDYRTTATESIVTFASRRVSRWDSQRDNSWLDLRRRALPPGDTYRRLRRPVQVLLTGIGFFLIALSTAFLVQGYKHEQIIRRHRTGKQAIFARTFPGQTVPAGIRTRLESEQKKISGMTGQAAMPNPVSALTVLYRVLHALPDTGMLRLEEIRVEQPGRCGIRAEVHSHADGSTIASALESAMFHVDPPDTFKMSDGLVALDVVARWQPERDRNPPRPSP